MAFPQNLKIMMDQLVQEFPSQLIEAAQIGNGAQIKAPDNPIHEVVVLGLGGSGIGGNLVGEFIRNHCSVPYTIFKGYHAPSFIDSNSVVICSSYSGNTEETLSMLEQVKSSGARIICVSSAGKLIETAKSEGYDHIIVPPGSPSPRACLGYSVVQQLFILTKLGLIDGTLTGQLNGVVELLNAEQDDIKNRAKNVARFLQNKIPVIYTGERMEAVGIRFRQQVNENSKMLCWNHVIPEMNHNELVGWKNTNNDLGVVFFRNRDDHPRNQRRMDLNKEIIGKYTDTIIELFSKGENLLERSMYFIHLGDWISVELAALNGADAMEIEVIDYLKGELAKM